MYVCMYVLDLGSIWGRSEVDLGSIWNRSGVDLGSIWRRSGVDLGPPNATVKLVVELIAFFDANPPDEADEDISDLMEMGAGEEEE